MRRLGAVAFVAAALALSCGRSGRSSSSSSAVAATPPDPIAPLHAFEEERRRAVDFAHLPPSDRALGPDPIAIRALPGEGPPRFVGLLRARDALVLLDASLHEIARTATPALPTGVAVAEDGAVCVSGEQSPRVSCYAIDADAIRETNAVTFHVYGLRDVAIGGAQGHRVLYAVDERAGQLLVAPLAAPAPRGRPVAAIDAAPMATVPIGAGAFRVARVGDRVIVDALLAHSLVVLDVDARGVPIESSRIEIHHDGPIWGFDVASTQEGLLVAAGGVEDHVLDRREGSFAFIDSFVFLYRVPPHGQPVRLGEVNVSELGAITPKAVLLRPLADGGANVLAAGYGADQLIDITWSADHEVAPTIATRSILPGAASIAGAGDALVFADPLLDAWFSVSAEHAPVVPVAIPDAHAPERSVASRIGEALFFTNLMAPWNRADGRLSRFTCETCHFEGYVDGRTHHTGRAEIHATTKPLLGLFNNRPHFSRALDPDLATMVQNEFRVAGSLSGHEPWFSLADTGLPWIGVLGARAAGSTMGPQAAPNPAPAEPVQFDPIGMRRALMTFLMDFSHRPNPAVLGRTSFTASERRGADLFAQRCERCHEARLITDDPATRIPRDRWETLVLSREDPIVWAATGYHRTGIEPYVHELGARAPSLRRLYKKHPYFTNGSAPTLRDVLDRVRQTNSDFWHEAVVGDAVTGDAGATPEGATALTFEEKDALLAFLDLL